MFGLGACALLLFFLGGRQRMVSVSGSSQQLVKLLPCRALSPVTSVAP